MQGFKRLVAGAAVIAATVSATVAVADPGPAHRRGDDFDRSTYR